MSRKGAAGVARQRTLPVLLLLILAVMALALVVRLISWQAALGYAIRADELDYAIPAQELTSSGEYVDTFISRNRGWTRVPLQSLLLALAFSTQPQLPEGAIAEADPLMSARFAAGNLAMIGVSVLLIPLVMLLAAEAFPRRRHRAALIAGILTALYPPLVSSSSQQLLSETLFITLLFAALFTLTRWQPGRNLLASGEQNSGWQLFHSLRPPGERPTWPWLVGAGFLFGLAALARPVVIGFLPFLLIWFWSSMWASSDKTSDGKRLGVRMPRGLIRASVLVAFIGLFFLLAISPWTLYNYSHYGRLLLLDTANMNAFWYFNNYRGDNLDAILAQYPNPADHQAVIIGRGLSNILERPDLFGQQIIYSLHYVWHLEWSTARIPNAYDLTQRDPEVPATIPTDAAFLLVSLAGLVGLAALGLRRPTEQAGRVRLLVLLWLGYMLLLGVVIPYDARYRMPMAPALIIFVAGLFAMANWRRVPDLRPLAGKAQRPRLVVISSILLCAWVLVGALTPDMPAAARSMYLAWQAERTSDPVAAASVSNRAIAADPSSFWPYYHAAELARAAGRDDEARLLYLQALDRGSEPRAVLGLADLLYRHPDWQTSLTEREWLLKKLPELRGAPWNSFRPTPRDRVEAGERDLGYLAGFYDAEHDAELTYRWSTGAATIHIAAPADTPATTAIRLRLAAPAVSPAEPMLVTVSIDGAGSQTISVDSAWNDYTIKLDQPISGDLLIHLSSQVRRPQAFNPASTDARLLGVGLQWVARVSNQQTQ